MALWRFKHFTIEVNECKCLLIDKNADVNCQNKAIVPKCKEMKTSWFNRVFPCFKEIQEFQLSARPLLPQAPG